MLDSEQVDTLRAALIDRFSPEELCEVLRIETEDIVDRFIEEVLRTDWGDYL